jgi:hypothetical protein
MAGVVAGQPLDTLRIRLQQRGCAQRSLAGAWRALAAAEGPRALFRGMSYPLYTTALQNAVTFQAQRAAERGLHAAGAAPGMASTCAAGMFAGAVQTFISSPVELLKIRLQLQRAHPGAPDYVGPLGMLRRVLRDEGAAGARRPGAAGARRRARPSVSRTAVAAAPWHARATSRRPRPLRTPPPLQHSRPAAGLRHHAAAGHPQLRPVLCDLRGGVLRAGRA